MRAAFKIAVGILAVYGALAVLVTVYAFLSIDCAETTLAQAESPDGALTADATLYTCQEPSKSRLVVYLRTPDRSSSVDVLRAPPTTSNIRLTWTRHGNLRIAHPENLPIEEGASQWRGARVYIDTFPQSGS